MLVLIASRACEHSLFAFVNAHTLFELALPLPPFVMIQSFVLIGTAMRNWPLFLISAWLWIRGWRRRRMLQLLRLPDILEMSNAL